MAEPDDSYNSLVQVLYDYDYGHAWVPDVQHSLLNAIEQGNDQNAVAALVNAHPMPDGSNWFSPTQPPQSFPPRNDQPITGPNDDDHELFI